MATRKPRRLPAKKQLLFIAAGLANTLVDFVVFNLVLAVFGVAPWQANIVSTSVAMVLSFLMNKHAVFRDAKPSTYRQFAVFVAVTALGLWGLQTTIVAAASPALLPIARHALGLPQHSAHLLAANGAKAVATVASAVWNYFWYDRVIFAQSPTKSKLQEWM